MSRDPVEYYNRYTRQVEEESIYGESWLRWTYGNPLGRLALHALVKRAAFSRWYGWRMDRPASRDRIRPFIERYQIPEDEFLEPAGSFRSFNEFFHRQLKTEARPIHPDPQSVVFPADGRHLGFQDFSRVDGILVKGELFSLESLLHSPELARSYHRGTVVISRLCPVDYHRYHFPVEGVPAAPRLVQGSLFSVSPIALRRDIRILARNRRWITEMTTERFGRVIVLEVGATNVGSAVPTFRHGHLVAKGAEKGYFRFGGSLMVCLFEPGRVVLEEDLVRSTARRLELYARVGDVMGRGG